MEKTLALASIYELQGLKEQALEVYKSILTSDPHHKEALQGCKRLATLAVPIKSVDKSPSAKSPPVSKQSTLAQYAPLQHFRVQNMQAFFIQATSQAELQTIEEWLIRWN